MIYWEGVEFVLTDYVCLCLHPSRSTGYGSLQVWIKYIRKGVIFHDKYQPSSGCTQSTWTGSAFTIGGGYVWSDVYQEAAKRNVVVVGGGTPVGLAKHESCPDVVNHI